MTTELNQFSHFVPHLLLVLIEVVESHHMTVVGVITTDLSVLIALVDTRHAGEGHVEYLHQQRTFVSDSCVSDAYFAGPSLFFALAVDIYNTAGDGGETYLIMVTGDISHGMVCAVCTERSQFVLHDLIHTLYTA